MGFDEFNFTRYYRCPSCKVGMIVIDNKIVSCPVCEFRKTKKLEK
ncbi:MAG: hypothetical protein ACXADU_12035 [Promethearchaeota archaeon]